MFIKSEQIHIESVIAGEVIWCVPADVIFHMPGNYCLECKSYDEYTKCKNYRAKLGNQRVRVNVIQSYSLLFKE